VSEDFFQDENLRRMIGRRRHLGIVSFFEESFFGEFGLEVLSW
jgi:hypothetical protein